MQQITRGDYLKDLITIYIENNLQTDITELYSQFIFQCGEIQKAFTPAQVIKISFSEQESLKLKNLNTCYLAGITVEGHKETFNGSLTFNTRGEVVNYEPTASGSVTVSGTTANDCGCQGLRGVFSNCCQPAIKAYFSLNYVPTKLSELINDTDFVDSVDVAESVSIHNASTEAHPYIQGLISSEASVRASETEALGVRIDNEVSIRASQTEALSVSIQAETTAREQAISLAISTTEGYADTLVSSATTAINTTIGDLDNLDTSVKSSVVNAINSEVSARQGADNNLQGQIDAIVAGSDVTDIVGTYADLQAYDKTKLSDKDIIKVLSDSTHNDAPSYYRYSKSLDSFSYVGSEAETYTKAESNSLFVTQTTTINNKPLSADITLNSTDVGALPSTTTITNLASTTQMQAINSGVTSTVVTQVGTNTSAISTINGKIPTDASSTNKLVSASTLAAAISPLANKDLSNLSDTGNARLHALKAYADKGELLTDAEGLADVENYAHSTFDLSKFTVVGSPNITNDGIASGFNTSNYIQIPFLSSVTNFTAELNFKFNDTSTASYSSYCIHAASSPFMIFINASNGKYGNITAVFTDSTISTQYNLGTIDGSSHFLTERIYFEYRLLNNILSCRVRFGEIGHWVNFPTTHTITEAISTKTYSRLSGYSAIFNCDLKQFSITVGGVPVFSGNKTGIDTVKPDDYTVVGTPTISADGIASGFSGNDYITATTLNLSTNSNVTIKFRYAVAPTLGGNSWILTTSTSSDYTVGLNLNINKTTRLLTIGFDSTRTVANDTTITLGKTYDFVITLRNGKAKVDFIEVGTGTLYEGEEITIPDSWSSSTPLTIGALIGNVSFYTYGSIDLNAFKIYVDGNLVYQPCLKIPYTESKTGSKIVDSIYRDRVNDMAEQFGFAPYYTLSDTDFTLPQVELYGLIGQRTLRDSYRNGINYWELYSNRDLEQGGSCTSGVEVTFARPFADTNYVLSVPYSAKSATAFTPTQTGDWIAKGKGIL